MQAFKNLASFAQNVVQEAKKVTWPTRQEVTLSTTMIVVMIVFVSAFLLVVDLTLNTAIKFILGLA
ncbi:MAG: preprotein translocase subunit SecE [Alphaproteobacteria bacterium]|nr:preprotein translocase subunit SecE [Alphaproteobacteria bacterium]NDC56056.1 preprotein translocase subunit SecE [Alphaproteobacteria bacterium]NDG04144.1 preprotein translocase subunit SecE [Alphaproteobacteria bacterium]